MQIPTILANFVMCYIWVYVSVLVVHGTFDVLRYLVDSREKRTKKIDSNQECVGLDQFYR